MSVTRWRRRKAVTECHKQFQAGQARAPRRISLGALLTAGTMCCLGLGLPVAATADGSQTPRHAVPHDPTPQNPTTKVSSSNDGSTAPAARLVLATAAPTTPTGRDFVVTIRKGDTLMDILARLGIAPNDRLPVIDALGDLLDPTNLRIGSTLRLTIDRQQSRRVVTVLHLETGKAEDLTIKVEPYASTAGDADHQAAARSSHSAEMAQAGKAPEKVKSTDQATNDRSRIWRQPDAGAASALPNADQLGAAMSGTDQSGADLSNTDESGLDQSGQFIVRHAAGIVGNSFRNALQSLRLPSPLVNEVLLAFKYDADAPSVPPRDAAFSVIYEGVTQGDKFEDPQLRYAELNDGHKTHRVYRYQTGDATTAFIHSNGQGIAMVDLGKPLRIEARITSPYGWRIHPVFGDLRFHEGVDFGAPKGTPVVATADGKIEDIGWRGNYGEYIRVRHDGHLATAYAHLAGFARGMHRGSEVKRGEIIGYVGRTGVATGPHLYYEVMIDGKRIDPMKTPPVMQVSLTGTQLAEFEKFVEATPQE
jgi:murein DD-endopeptidase MepM/ murein hydrolase activator NlpD